MPIVIDKYSHGKPFPHTVIDGPLVPDDLFRMAGRAFLAGELLGTSPQMRSFVNKFRTPSFLDFVATNTDLDRPELTGISFRSSKAEETVSLSNGRHGVGVVAFLGEEWHDDWRGYFELWSEQDGHPWREEKLIRPIFGRIVLFDLRGWHGFPAPLECPGYAQRIWFQAVYRTSGSDTIPTESAADSAASS